MKRLGILALVVLVPALILAAAPPETITLEGCGDKQPAVEFPHAVHAAAADCVTCHHTSEGLTADSGGEVQGCKTCHLNPESADTPDCSQMSMTKNPFHKGCINCHKEQKQGPTKCADCHVKK